jgi:hypothetical protein
MNVNEKISRLYIDVRIYYFLSEKILLSREMQISPSMNIPFIFTESYFILFSLVEKFINPQEYQ